MRWKMMAVASSPIAQAQNEFAGRVPQAVCEAVLPQISPRRANTQGNDDMTAITGCCKSTPSLFLFSFACLSQLGHLSCQLKSEGSLFGFPARFQRVLFFRVDMSSLFLLFSWMSLYWMFSTTVDLQWDMDVESELTKNNWEKILGYQRRAFSVACSFEDSHC